MKHTHIACILSASALLALAMPVKAQEWPAPGKTIQLIVPAPGGSGTGDTIARLIADRVGRRLGTTLVIDNKAGANGNIGAAAAASAAPDGYKLLFSWAGTLAVNPSLYKNLPFDPQKSFAPVGLVAQVPNILVVNKDLPARDFKEFLSYAKANPEKINFGSTGSGSSMHLAGALVMHETGVRMTHVPYNAPGQATTNLISNEIQAMFQLIPGIVGQVKAGSVRALAVMDTARSPALPDVPTTKELGFPKLMSSTWFALLAPQGTPPAVLDRLNKELNAVLADEDVRKSLADMGASPLSGTRQALTDHLSQETRKWQQVVREEAIQVQ
jgi:tripartite-type tricarboxylate transporter receptor subunit TctC